MINDVCKMKNPLQAKIYKKVSQKGHNACIGVWPWEAMISGSPVPAQSLVIWSVEDIGPGQEIFIPYGIHYWVTMTAWLEQTGIVSPADRINLNAMD